MSLDPFVFHDEAVRLAQATPMWLIEGLVSQGTTMFYGEPKIGKSFLVSHLVAALLDNGEFLGVQVPQDREFRIVVGWTDALGQAEYAERIETVLGTKPDPERLAYQAVYPMRLEDFDELLAKMVEGDYSLLVIDNLSSAIKGSYKDDDCAKLFFQGVNRIVAAGIPVVLVGHSSDKPNLNGFVPTTILGSTLIKGQLRLLCFMQRTLADNIKLKFSGNHRTGHQVTVKHGAGARFRVVGRMTEESVQRADEGRANADQGRRGAIFVAENCQGKGLNEAAHALLSSDLRGIEENTFRSWLAQNGKIGKHLTRTGSRQRTVWVLKPE